MNRYARAPAQSFVATCSFFAGTFGRVLECWDRKYKDYCAVKIVRNVDKYRHAAMIEVGALTLLLIQTHAALLLHKHSR
jgi:hypothetical protein